MVAGGSPASHGTRRSARVRYRRSTCRKGGAA
jgi:hypothetical protein